MKNISFNLAIKMFVAFIILTLVFVIIKSQDCIQNVKNINPLVNRNFNSNIQISQKSSNNNFVISTSSILNSPNYDARLKTEENAIDVKWSNVCEVMPKSEKEIFFMQYLPEGGNEHYTINKVGVVDSGKYLGDNLYLLEKENCGDVYCGTEFISFLIEEQGSFTFLRKDSILYVNEETVYDNHKKFIYDENTVIKNLFLGGDLYFENKKVLSGGWRNLSTSRNGQNIDRSKRKVANVKDLPGLYDSGDYSIFQGCFNEISYRSKFIDSHLLDNDIQTIQLDIIWQNGATGTSQYSIAENNECFGGESNYKNEISSQNLVIIGKTSEGDLLYELTDQKHKSLDGEEMLQNIYQGYLAQFDDETLKNAKSYDEFLINHSVIFWQDDFGPFLQLILKDFSYTLGCS
ncbi:MAG: hypothetical protein WCK11_00620 [Candidatus Falkowbacteria bacterium]